jgi:hypothetical protein
MGYSSGTAISGSRIRRTSWVIPWGQPPADHKLGVHRWLYLRDTLHPTVIKALSIGYPMEVPPAPPPFKALATRYSLEVAPVQTSFKALFVPNHTSMHSSPCLSARTKPPPLLGLPCSLCQATRLPPKAPACRAPQPQRGLTHTSSRRRSKRIR